MVVPEELILTVIRSPNGFIKVNFQTSTAAAGSMFGDVIDYR